MSAAIDVKRLRPFPSWGEPISDELITVRSSVNGKAISYRVAVMPDVPRRETGHLKSPRVSGDRQDVRTESSGFDAESEYFS